MPVKEVITFNTAGGTMDLVTTFGPLPLAGIQGTCTWLPADSTVSFRLDTIMLGPLRFAKPGAAEAEPKTYRFFYADGSIAAARSSAGSLSLLKRQ